MAKTLIQLTTLAARLTVVVGALALPVAGCGGGVANDPTSPVAQTAPVTVTTNTTKPAAQTGAATATASPSATATQVPAPTAAYLVPASAKATLQQALDQYHSVQLEPNADYATGGPATINVTTGEQILGGWNTILPPIQIAAGASNVLISGIRGAKSGGDDITFLPGSETTGVRIVGAHGLIQQGLQVRISAGAQVTGIEVYDFRHLIVDQSQSGHVRNSIFTGADGYAVTPLVTWNGNTTDPSGPNTFASMVSITGTAASQWTNAGDLWLLGWDAESWNYQGGGDTNAYIFGGKTRIYSIGVTGGTGVPTRTGAMAKFASVDGVMMLFTQGHGGQLDNADFLFENVGTRLTSQSAADVKVADVAPQGDRLFILDPAARSPVALATVAGAMPGGITALPTQLSWALSASPPGYPIGKPARRTITDPLGDQWLSAAAGKPDSSTAIQAQIDSSGVAVLAPGVYYLDHPLKLGSNKRSEAILGAGSTQVVLAARGAFPVIQGRGDMHYATNGVVMEQVAIEGLTLYGGTDGIRFSSEAGNSGDGAQIAWSMFSDLKFLRQTEAGVYVKSIFGIDNNLWNHDDFLGLPVAFLGAGTGYAAGMNYADKQQIIDCQFQQIAGYAWNWQAQRPSNVDIFSGDYFYEVGGVSATTQTLTALWTNSVMENVSGSAAIHSVDGTGANFYQYDNLWTGTGPSAITDAVNNNAMIAVKYQQSGGQIASSTSARTLDAIGTTAPSTIGSGSLTQGLLINSQIGTYTEPVVVLNSSAALPLSLAGLTLP
jgi:hypothetical protein